MQMDLAEKRTKWGIKTDKLTTRAFSNEKELHYKDINIYDWGKSFS